MTPVRRSSNGACKMENFERKFKELSDEELITASYFSIIESTVSARLREDDDIHKNTELHDGALLKDLRAVVVHSSR